MRALIVPVLLATFLVACSDDAPTGATPADDASLDVTASDDTTPSDTTVAADAPVEDSGELDTSSTTDTGGTSPDTRVDTGTETATPMCIAAGIACSSTTPCCPGNKCISGFCRGCVAKGGFCTWAEKDRCCSGSCDGDSCNGYPVGAPCTSSSQCQLNNCVAGVCACAIGDAPCGTAGACVDIDNNDAHCGACGKACGPNQRCISRKCECRDSFTTNCGADCYDTRVEEAHCGACGTACRSDQVCAFSTCRCSTGTECGGACVFTSTDPNNCGTCGNVCPTARPRCAAGVCSCALGLTQCSTACVNLQTDRANCGSCGNTCAGMKMCVAGVCS